MSSSPFDMLCPFSKEESSIAIEEAGVSLSYQDFAAAVYARARALEQLGVHRGDRVAFIATTSTTSIIFFFALLHIEATPCPLSTRIPQSAIPPLLFQARISFFLHIDPFSLEKMSSYDHLAPAILLFTSGSSGAPKLVHLEWKHFFYSALGSISYFDLPGRWLLSVPLFHVSGLSILFRCLMSRSCILLSPSANVTHLSFVPTQLLRLLREDEFPFPSLRYLLLGGAPLLGALQKKASERGLPVHTTYGLTETASLVTLATDIQNRVDSFHLGKALPYRELSLSAEGEILVKGSTLFSGYDTDAGLYLPLTQDGWFATKDIGYLSKEGHLIYRGRKDNMFISGGENIYPEDIEKILATFPAVALCMVVPIQDEEFGQRPIAFVHMLEGSIPSKQQLNEYLVTFLPKFYCPIEYLPFPPSIQMEGKISRKTLQEYASYGTILS